MLEVLGSGQVLGVRTDEAKVSTFDTLSRFSCSHQLDTDAVLIVFQG